VRSLRGVVGNFTRRTEVQLVEALTAQIVATTGGVATALAVVRGELDSAAARERMATIEHDGDAERARVVGILARSLASPIDREDLFRFSRSIDDVLDNLRDFVREHDLFELGPDPLLENVLEGVDVAVHNLRDAVAAVRDDPWRIRDATLRVKKNEIRPRYQLAMAQLLTDPVSVRTLKGRELLRRLDVVGLRLGEAADALADGAMKRSR
jgi:uncharacterized protein Yka (UPF0111/DUF47 family)